MNTNKIFFVAAFILQVAVGLTAKISNREQCFNTLNETALHELKNAYFSEVEDIISEPIPSKMFACFVKASSQGHESFVEQHLNVYRKLVNFKDNDLASFGNSQIQELLAMGLSRDYENYLKYILESGSKEKLKLALSYIQYFLEKDIEYSQVYKDFKMLISKIYGRDFQPGRAWN